MHSINPYTQEAEIGRLLCVLSQGKFEASQGYLVRPCLKNKQTMLLLGLLFKACWVSFLNNSSKTSPEVIPHIMGCGHLHWSMECSHRCAYGWRHGGIFSIEIHPSQMNPSCVKLSNQQMPAQLNPCQCDTQRYHSWTTISPGSLSLRHHTDTNT